MTPTLVPETGAPEQRKEGGAMKLGSYTCGYVDRLEMPIEPALEAAAAAGHDGIDVSAAWHDDLDPADARGRCVRTAGRPGLEIEAVITHLGLVRSLQGLPINLKGAADVA